MWGYQDHSFVEHYKTWHDHAWDVRDPREEICLFSNPEGVSQQQQDNLSKRALKTLPAGIKFNSSLWIHGEYVLLAFTRGPYSTHSATIIFNPNLAQNLRDVFLWLWRSVG